MRCGTCCAGHPAGQGARDQPPTSPSCVGWTSPIWNFRRFHLHLTPTSASRLNQAEIGLSVLRRHRLESGTSTSTENSEASIQGYIAETDAHPDLFI